MARVDFDSMAPSYDAGRGLPPDAFQVWRRAIAPFLPREVSRILDLGCGTGHFTAMLADSFQIDVVGVEPSIGMLRVAMSSAGNPRVSYVLGRAEAIPLRDASCDTAWLSTVIHHFDDLGSAARELRRVLRPGSPVLIRSWFPGRADVLHFRYFPGARRIAETFPTIDETTEAFASAGFRRTSMQSVAQVSAQSLRAAADRFRLRADTTLQQISDDEFEEGMQALEADADSETVPAPVVSQLDLLVFLALGQP